VPALLWVLLGPIFLGAVHDFGALIISARSQGKSIGEISAGIINHRVRMIFLLVIFFCLWIVVAIFGMIIAIIFNLYPQSVFPIWMEIPVAVWLGHMIYIRKVNRLLYSIIAVTLLYVTVFIGAYWPLKMPSLLGLEPMVVWVAILLIYAYIASTLPVWRLLQPRDYINGHELYVAMALLVVAVFASHPVVSAPAVALTPQGAPPIWPFLFVTIACGAISGFHSLVSSGTSAKQLQNETDALPIGYGSMLLEGALAVLVLVAVAGGIGDKVAWTKHYASWSAAAGLGANLDAFVNGSANMMAALGIPTTIAVTIMGVFVASFAGTTLDTAARIQRYVVTELATAWKIKPLTTRHGATLFAVIAAAILAFHQGDAKGALVLWPLFGATNQLLAGLALLVITMYLVRKGIPSLYTAIPMVIMIVITAWAMVSNIATFFSNGQWLLFVIGCLVMLLEVWMIVETISCYVQLKREPLREAA
jgi:carbon starvation protein